VFGTRPEATKLVPVIFALRATRDLTPIVLVSGQHREQLASVLEGFGIHPDLDFDVMTDRQPLPALLARVVPRAAAGLRDAHPDFVIVQGDTMTTFGVSLAAFFESIPIAHIEAGLRTGNLRDPFPEEATRRLTSVLVDLHLAPTQTAKRNLLREGVLGKDVVVTGQTAVDGIRLALRVGKLPPTLAAKRLVTITMHRRENWPRLGGLAGSIAALARAHRQWTFVFPVHRNPTVREAVYPVLRGIDNVRLVEPLDYPTMAALLGASRLVITDSGGLQEEGVTLGVPVVVLRERTERPEGLRVGGAILAGTDPENVYATIADILRKLQARTRPTLSPAPNPYGDGRASARIVRALRWRLGLASRPNDWSEFQGADVHRVRRASLSTRSRKRDVD
jgi:UDP-N-acetylglucosamine 2-epimerase (non-hydrolysing)